MRVVIGLIEYQRVFTGLSKCYWRVKQKLLGLFRTDLASSSAASRAKRASSILFASAAARATLHTTQSHACTAMNTSKQTQVAAQGERERGAYEGKSKLTGLGGRSRLSDEPFPLPAVPCRPPDALARPAAPAR